MCKLFVTTLLKRSGETKIDNALVHLCDFRHCVRALLDHRLCDKTIFCTGCWHFYFHSFEAQSCIRRGLVHYPAFSLILSSQDLIGHRIWSENYCLHGMWSVIFGYDRWISVHPEKTGKIFLVKIGCDRRASDIHVVGEIWAFWKRRTSTIGFYYDGLCFSTISDIIRPLVLRNTM